MTPTAAIVAQLSATTAVTDIVSDRIYSVSAKDGVTSPHIIIQQIGADPAVTHSGASGATERLFQFTCFAGTPKDARALRDAVIAALDGVVLGNGDNPTLEDERDGDVDDDAKLFRADCDFLV
jgi:hypothetical protein